jgi:perosamine synthetase
LCEPPAMRSEPMIPLVEPDLRGNEEAYLCECVRTGWVSTAGPYVREMERRLAALVGCDHVVATASGTVALQLLLLAMGIGRGHRVIVPDWTFAATVNSVIHAEAVPIFIDVHPDFWSLDPALVEAELGRAAHDEAPIAAVVVVDPLGLPADMDALLAVCRRYGVPLIEDSAGAIGSQYKGRPAGGLVDAAILSFNGNKLVTGGGGGAIMTDREDWAKLARHLSTQARSDDRYAYDAVGFNYRLTNLNAAVVVAQLERLDEMMAARRANAAAYGAAIAGRGDLAAPPQPNWATWNGWMYAVRTASAAQADRLTAHLEARGVGARPFWLGLSAQSPYADYPRRLSGVSQQLSGALVSLPCGSTLTAAQRDQVIAGLASWRGETLGRG